MDSIQNNDNALSKYTDVDLAGFVAPNIVFHQASADAKPQAFQFDTKRVIYDREQSAPNMQGTKMLAAKYQLPDTADLVDLYIETPVMQSLWGCSAFHSENIRNGKTVDSVNYSLQLSFNDMSSNRQQEDFYKAMFQWDQYLMQQIYANKSKWMPGSTIKSVDALEALFTGVCKPRMRQRDGQLFPPPWFCASPRKAANWTLSAWTRTARPTTSPRSCRER